jgi:acyl-CoA reductase-like NAD-dependent aldehyde dehydrogenase
MSLLTSVNPATLEVLGSVPISTAADIASTIRQGRYALRHWAKLPLHLRLRFIESLRLIMLERLDEIATLITQESGKTFGEALAAELGGPLDTCLWVQKNLPQLLTNETTRYNPVAFYTKSGYNVFEPVGIVAVIAPWNYPFTIPINSIIMAVAAGNAVILKPSPKTPLIGQLIVDLFRAAGFPEGLVSIVQGDKDEASALITGGKARADRVNHVVFVGSVPGGRAIAALCNKNLIPFTLELGGKHPAIVREDADIDKIAWSLLWGAFTNAGQACVSIERLYVHRSLADRLMTKIADLAQGLQLGNGLDPNTQVGPLIDLGQLERVQAQVQDAIAKGARVLAGGKARTDLGGFFFEPTVLTNVTPDMRIMTEEIFGPVLPIIIINHDSEALEQANDSDLGLGASIWTADIEYGKTLARNIDAGLVWINGSIYSHASPDVPWGGYKNSGSGITHSAHGLKNFVRVKHISWGSQRAQDWEYPYCQERNDLIKASIGIGHGGMINKLRSAYRAARNWLGLPKRK